MIAAYAITVTAAVGMSALPFAFTDTVSAAIIAGIFSIVNTVLNILLIHTIRHRITPNVERTAEVADRIKLRKGDREGDFTGIPVELYEREHGSGDREDD